MTLKNIKEKLFLHFLKVFINLWPPLLGAGIKMVDYSNDFRYVKAILKKSFFNTNYVGTHFGGSIYSLTDPFYMLMLLRNLGKEYIVWDKAGKIEYKKPGRGTLTAIFEFSAAELADIKNNTDQNGKYVFDKAIDIKDEQNDIVASAVRTLYVRRKDTLNSAK